MTDKKWVAASAEFGPLGFPQVLFKCWESGDLQLGIIVGPYDESASYAKTVTAKFRIDKEQPSDVLLVPTNFNGYLNLTTASSVDPTLVLLLRDILNSKNRVALSVGSAVFQSDVRGTSKSIGPMFKTCNLGPPDDEFPPDAAAAASTSKK